MSNGENVLIYYCQIQAEWDYTQYVEKWEDNIKGDEKRKRKTNRQAGRKRNCLYNWPSKTTYEEIAKETIRA